MSEITAPQSNPQPVQQNVQQPPSQVVPILNPPLKKTSRLAIAALVFSVLGIIPLFSIVGFILGIIALSKIKNDPQLSGEGIAITAIVLGAFFGIILGIAFLGLFMGFTKGMMAKAAAISPTP